ncbi:MAG TPA: ABC transporter permease [Pyrinomonadaceae bacterium]|nr:ABC transporter permease [Pyrinomonadaceae bacterium]
MIKDFRHGIRSLLKHRGFTAVAVITLGLGIGASTLMFSVVNAVLLRPLPYPNPDRLVSLSQSSLEEPDLAVSYPDFLDWRSQNSVFEDMAARLPTGGVIQGANEPERVIGRLVTPSFFSTLGVQPLFGRSFTEAENTPGAAPVMVISHGLWQRQFGGSRDVIGKPITYNGAVWTVIGVLQPSFDFYGRTNINNDIFTPLGLLGNQDFMRDRNSHAVRVTARLKPDVSIERARSELNAIAGRLANQYPSSNTGIGVTTRSFLDDYVGDFRYALRVIFAAVGFMLLIACANVANLMLARATSRSREIALRLALGASRWRITQQLMIESLILAVVGGVFGVLLATWGISLLSKIDTGELSRLDEVSIDGRVFLFTFLVTLIVGSLAGLLPTLQNSRFGLNEVFKTGDRSSASSGGRLRRSLVAAEVAVALLLLVGAGLTLRSFERLISVEPGFDPQNVLTFRLRLPDAKYKDASQTFAFLNDTAAKVAALPGVERVALATGFPLGRATDTTYLVEGQAEPLPGRTFNAVRQDVSGDYLDVLRIPLLAGRHFNSQDTETSPLVVIVDREFVARNFPNQMPSEVVGKRLRFTGDSDGWREIVGIVGHVKQSGLNEQDRPEIYRPLTQIPQKYKAGYTRAADMLVKTTVDPLSLVGAIKKEIRLIDDAQPIAQVQTLDDKLSSSMAPQRLNLLLLGIFALIALSLASAGIYGVMSYAVTQRTHEIGVRMALGAQRRDVLKLIVRQGMSLLMIGVAFGLAGAIALTRFMNSVLFDVTARDPLTFVGVTVVLTIVALLACYIPARRATKVDPLVALRYE